MMRVKRYQASTLEEALHLVRSDLGRDAIILETHRVRLPGLKGLFAPQITEVAAVGDNSEVHVPWDVLSKPEHGPARPFTAHKHQEPALQPAVTLAKAQPGEVADVLSLSAEAAALAAGRAEPFVPSLATADDLPRVVTSGAPRRPEPALDAPEAAVIPFTRRRSAQEPVPAAAGQDLAAEVEELHAMLAQVQAALRDLSTAQTHMLEGAKAEAAAKAPPAASVPSPGALGDLAASVGLSVQALALLGLTGATAADEVEARGLLEAALAAQIPVADAAAPSGRPVVLLLIGGTGVGKSSAAGRIAALLAPEAPVALATIGASGLAGPSQLLTHCVNEGVTFRACRGMNGLAAFLAEEAGRFRYVVVDTPGGNLHAPDTRTLVNEAHKLDAEVRVLLVASASTQPSVIERAAAAFPDGEVHGLVVTKLDEAGNFGALIDLALTRSLPVAYVSAAASLSTGLVPADAGTLAACVTGVRRSGRRDKPAAAAPAKAGRS